MKICAFYKQKYMVFYFFNLTQKIAACVFDSVPWLLHLTIPLGVYFVSKAFLSPLLCGNTIESGV